MKKTGTVNIHIWPCNLKGEKFQAAINFCFCNPFTGPVFIQPRYMTAGQLWGYSGGVLRPWLLYGN